MKNTRKEKSQIKGQINHTTAVIRYEITCPFIPDYSRSVYETIEKDGSAGIEITQEQARCIVRKEKLISVKRNSHGEIWDRP